MQYGFWIGCNRLYNPAVLSIWFGLAIRDFSSTVEISPTYYLDNFLALINSVHCRYHGILTDEEQGFRDAFLQLPTNAQCLFVRLVSRKGPLFRVDRLSYTEIDDVEGAI